MVRVVRVLSVLVLLSVAGCGGPGEGARPSAPSEASGTTTPSASPAPPAPATPDPSPGPTTSEGTVTPSPRPAPSDIDELLEKMTLEEKVGQIIMVGVPVTGELETPAAVIRDHHVANVFLHGRTEAGQAPMRELVDEVTAVGAAANPRDPLMLVATDQEGGLVQVLRGPGFSEIPSAVEQAELSPGELRREARRWGQELADVGVNLNLAPVADVVSRETAASNEPIGAIQRNYGFTLRSVTEGSVAFGAGMRASGVATTPKHFPGLGLTLGNTDTAAKVVDTVTGRDAKSVRAFRGNVEAGAEFVMMSSAYYELIDARNPALFSPAMVRLLRKDLGFDGVVMTDDVSAAAAVQPWPAGERAVRAVEAGVDLVLASADPTTAGPMAEALVTRAKSDPRFADRIDEAAARVLRAKSALG
ncbi:glycoside hydrolase family 3 N-terminal domain-containing protein [Myceligenerans crystallogenes]|uniref:beta-N-acetylhexosaminidase n=1 Tax=Myceligenerans crystallogenes TaxID=316335 RepID=A0ABN2NCJ7_9MICO